MLILSLLYVNDAFCDAFHAQGEISQTKRAVAILNRLFLVAQRANKSQRMHRKEEPYSQFYQLPSSYAVSANSAGRNDEVLSNDINSVENNSETGSISTLDQKAMTLPRVRNAAFFL